MNEWIYYFLLFIIYSIMGWIYESLLCSIRSKDIINRGFLTGPLCPIYGSGAVIVVFFLGKIENPLLVFVLGVLLTGTLEYLTSYIMERLFHAKWWDYSTRRFNVNGRVCLLGAFVFGCMSLLVIFFLNPVITHIMFKINYKVLYGLAFIAMVVIFIDFYLTVNNLLDLNKRLSKVQYAINKYIDYSKAKGNELLEESKIKKERIKDSFIEIFEESEFYSDKIKRILSRKNFQDKRMLTAFPHFKSTKYGEAFEKFKETIKKNMK